MEETKQEDETSSPSELDSRHQPGDPLKQRVSGGRRGLGAGGPAFLSRSASRLRWFTLFWTLSVNTEVKICPGRPPSCCAPWLPSSLPCRCGPAPLWSGPHRAQTKAPGSFHETHLEEKHKKTHMRLGKIWEHEEVADEEMEEYLLFKEGSERESSSTAYGREKDDDRRSFFFFLTP